MSIYDPPMAFTVTRDPEVGVRMVEFGPERPIVRTEQFGPVALVDVAADGSVVAVEVLSLDGFDLDGCAARYGFADQAGAIGMALARA